MTEFVDTIDQFVQGLKDGQKKIGLRYVKITSEEEVAAIASALAADPVTQRVSLVNASLNAVRMVPILQALKSNTHVQYLNLNNNDGGNESASSLADLIAHNKSLTEIFMVGNNIWDVGGDAILSSVEKSSTIQMLDLSGNKVNAKTVKKIAEICDNNL